MEIIKNDEIKAFLDAFSYFGESCLSKDEFNTKRSATVRAHTEVECLSIGRNSFFTIFGNEVESIVIRNSLRKMFRDSSVFKNFNIVQMEKCINKLERKLYNKDDVIVKANIKYETVFFIIDKYQFKDRLRDEARYQEVFNDIGFYNNIPLKYPDDIVAVSSECRVLEISYKLLYQILGKEDLEAVFATNKSLQEMFFRKRQIPKTQDYSSLSFVKTLGAGGQGLVVLVEDQERRKAALKVIAKGSVKTKYSMKLVKVLISYTERTRST